MSHRAVYVWNFAECNSKDQLFFGFGFFLLDQTYGTGPETSLGFRYSVFSRIVGQIFFDGKQKQTPQTEYFGGSTM